MHSICSDERNHASSWRAGIGCLQAGPTPIGWQIELGMSKALVFLATCPPTSLAFVAVRYWVKL